MNSFVNHGEMVEFNYFIEGLAFIYAPLIGKNLLSLILVVRR